MTDEFKRVDTDVPDWVREPDPWAKHEAMFGAKPEAPDPDWVTDGDTPAFDPATGEVLDPEPQNMMNPESEAQVSAWEDVGAGEGVLSVRFDFLASTAELHQFTKALREQIDDRIGTAYTSMVANRNPDLPIAEAVLPEMRALADAEETLTAVGKVFADAARNVKQVLGDVVLEARETTDTGSILQAGGSRSLRVDMPDGTDTKVAITQPTEVVTDTEGLLDVVVAALLDDRAEEMDDGEATAFAEGARAALDAVQGLTSPWKWKTTALDLWKKTLTPGLRDRVAKAYFRRAKGNPTISVTRERAE